MTGEIKKNVECYWMTIGYHKFNTEVNLIGM